MLCTRFLLIFKWKKPQITSLTGVQPDKGLSEWKLYTTQYITLQDRKKIFVFSHIPLREDTEFKDHRNLLKNA